MSSLSTFEQDAGKKVAIAMFWRDWGGSKSTISTTWLQSIASQGSTPMITWSPANWDPGTDQTPFTLANIAAGQDDAYINSWAQQLRSFGGPVLIRWAHEMNGDWYPWSGDPAAYVAAWRHIHDLFVADGATNVKWVWSPNVFWPGSLATDPSSYYPGDAYVDWLALDGYNKAPSGWMTFKQIFSYPYGRLTSMTNKPLMIAEVGSSEATPAQQAQGLSKAQWIHDALTTDIPSMPRIKALVWFNEDKTESEGCCNWTIESSPSAQAAFRQAVSASQYVS